MSNNQTIQQKRAAFALNKLLETGDKVDKELAQFIIGVPNMILSNGIGQTFAFLLSKKKSKMGRVFDIMKDWLEQQMPKQFPHIEDNIKFLRKFNSISQPEYLDAQHECLRLLEWLKRYARAFSEDK